MFVKPGGAIAATTTLVLLTVTAPALAGSGPAPPAVPPSAGHTPGTARTSAAGQTLAAARAAIEALPHSPRLLRELAGPISRGRRGASVTGTSVPGIDVAAFQHPNGTSINWTAVASAGYKFAAIKATEGDYYTNPWAATDLAAAKKAGLFVTAYHFAIPNASGGAAQARYAVRYAGYADGRQMLPLMLDIEYDPYAGTDGTNECYGLRPAAMTAWLAAFVQTARGLTGQFPVIYTTADWWDTCTGASTAFGADPMWVAAYGFASPPMPAGWRAWTFWQYTAAGTVRGVNSPGGTDLDVFNTGLVGLIDPGNQRTSAAAGVSVPVKSLDAVAKRPLTYKATGLPHGLGISQQGVIKGAAQGTGTYHVTVSAKNSSGNNGAAQFAWQVSSPAGAHASRPVSGRG